MRIRDWKRQEEQDGVAKGRGLNPQNLRDLDLLRAENRPLITISRSVILSRCSCHYHPLSASAVIPETPRTVAASQTMHCGEVRCESGGLAATQAQSRTLSARIPLTLSYAKVV